MTILMPSDRHSSNLMVAELAKLTAALTEAAKVAQGLKITVEGTNLEDYLSAVSNQLEDVIVRNRAKYQLGDTVAR